MIREGIQEALTLLLRLDASVIDAATRSLWVSILAVITASAVGIATGLVLAENVFRAARPSSSCFESACPCPPF